jgi:spermidine synthase
VKTAALFLFFASGFCGLVYEVVWIRAAGTALGNTTHATGTVVAVYMAGLALGARLGGRRADRLSPRRCAALYGALELGAAAAAVAVPFLLRGSEPLAGWGYRRLGEDHPAFLLLRAGLVAAALLPPTLLMGATLPALARFLAAGAPDPARETGRAYAVNTLGGAAGTLAAGFALIPAFGLWATTLGVAALNAAVGAAALALARAPRGEEGTAAETAAPPGPAAPPPPLAPRLLVALGGAAALVYEIAWTRALVLSLGSTVYAFTLILAAFILGLAGGSALAARLLPRVRDPRPALALAQTGAGLTALLLLPFLGDAPVRLGSLLARFGRDFERALALESAAVGLFIFVPTLFMGAAFPLACRWAGVSERGLGRAVGSLLAWNTSGSIAGTLLASFALVPALGLDATIAVAASANLVAGAALFLAARPRFRAAAAAAALAVPLAWALPRWDPGTLSAGARLYGPRFRGEVLAYAWDSYGLATVHRDSRGHLLLKVNGKTDGSTGPEDMATQRQLGHLPLLHHPRPRRVLVIGLGLGVTAAAVARHPIELLDVVELSPAVARLAEHFREANEDVLRDPRTRLTVGDGRAAVRFGREPYDVILSEPSNLWISGMASLFTRDFLEEVRRRLAPGGLACLWVHAYRLDPDDFRCVVRTFFSAFEHGSFWEVSPEGDYLLMGSPEPLRRPLSLLVARLAEARLGGHLPERTPAAVLGGLLAAAPAARGFAGAGPILTDDHCLVEYTAPKAMHRESGARTLALLDALRRAPAERELYEGEGLEEVARRRELRRRQAERIFEAGGGNQR